MSRAEIEAIYIPLPNGLHAEWTIAALEAGKAVLCEKPLCVTPEETRLVLGAAEAASVPLWEAFVFPFHEHIARVSDALAGGQIGEVREIVSRFFHLCRTIRRTYVSPQSSAEVRSTTSAATRSASLGRSSTLSRTSIERSRMRCGPPRASTPSSGAR